MKLRRLLAVPFAVVADACTLCNMGERSFTQQVFDAEARERRSEQELAALKEITRLLDASIGRNGGSHG
jgi:hypothetical protein